MNGARLGRIIAAELGVARLAADRPRADELMARDLASLTDAECADVWRRLCQRPPGAPEPRAA